MAAAIATGLLSSCTGHRRILARMTRGSACLLAVFAALAVAACSHAPASGPGDRGSAADDDPWVVRGSATAGPRIGNPPGPYTPR
jgi:hypothetical protein